MGRMPFDTVDKARLKIASKITKLAVRMSSIAKSRFAELCDKRKLTERRKRFAEKIGGLNNIFEAMTVGATVVSDGDLKVNNVQMKKSDLQIHCDTKNEPTEEISGQIVISGIFLLVNNTTDTASTSTPENNQLNNSISS